MHISVLFLFLFLARTKTSSFDSETRAICDRLEKKIEGLSRLGGNLPKDSLETDRRIKDHDKKRSKIGKHIQKSN